MPLTFTLKTSSLHIPSLSFAEYPRNWPLYNLISILMTLYLYPSKCLFLVYIIKIKSKIMCMYIHLHVHVQYIHILLQIINWPFFLCRITVRKFDLWLSGLCQNCSGGSFSYFFRPSVRSYLCVSVRPI